MASTTKKRLTVVDMVKEFQCPGCVNGSDPESCSRYQLSNDYGARCRNHCAGTNILGSGRIALGLPKGFNRYGLYQGKTDSLMDAINGEMTIRLWPDGGPQFDRFNVPVWRLEQDGMLFVRTMAPRVNGSFVDVIQLNGKKANQIAPTAIDAGEFFEDYD